MSLAIIESPYAHKSDFEWLRNIQYARIACKEETFLQRTAFASHLFYTQYLDDTVAHERKLGIESGFKIMELTKDVVQVFYVDFGMSKGMIQAVEKGEKLGVQQEFKTLFRTPSEKKKFIHLIDINHGDIRFSQDTKKAFELSLKLLNCFEV